MNLRKSLVVAVLALAGAAGTAGAQKVLWYGRGASYDAAMTALTGPNPGWTMTFWDGSGAAPIFSTYDVLVVQSQAGGWAVNPVYTGLLAADAALKAARGKRTFLSGQDADWHYMNGPGHVANGPQGFLSNAINWAAAGGGGIGIVGLQASNWWDGSFLCAEICGNDVGFSTQSVVIPVATAGFPVNAGLTSAGLSNWSTSSHIDFASDIPGYLSINDDGNRPDCSRVFRSLANKPGNPCRVTIVTASEASGGTTVPEPTSIALVATGLLGLAGVARRRRAA